MTLFKKRKAKALQKPHRTVAMMEEVEPRRMFDVTDVGFQFTNNHTEEGHVASFSLSPTCTEGDSVYAYDIYWAGIGASNVSPDDVGPLLSHLIESAGNGTLTQSTADGVVPDGSGGWVSPVNGTESETGDDYTDFPVYIKAWSNLDQANFCNGALDTVRIYDSPPEMSGSPITPAYTGEASKFDFTYTDFGKYPDYPSKFLVDWHDGSDPVQLNANQLAPTTELSHIFTRAGSFQPEITAILGDATTSPGTPYMGSAMVVTYPWVITMAGTSSTTNDHYFFHFNLEYKGSTNNVQDYVWFLTNKLDVQGVTGTFNGGNYTYGDEEEMILSAEVGTSQHFNYNVELELQQTYIGQTDWTIYATRPDMDETTFVLTLNLQ